MRGKTITDRHVGTLLAIIRRVNEAETALDRITEAWEAMSFTERIEVDDISHRLADAIARGVAQALSPPCAETRLP